MQSSSPAIAREAVRPLRRLVAGPDGRTLPVRARLLRALGVPVGLLALVGLALANGAYLQDVRGMTGLLAPALSVGATLPVVIAVRRPLLAWRVAYPLLYLGTARALDTESWPWAPVQIVGFLAVLLLVALVEDTAVTVWVVAFSAVPPFLYADRANAYGVLVLFMVIALLGDVVSRRRRSRAQLAEQAELTELERARRAVLQERTRIAREMHDVVAHHMSMIAVRAETAPYRMPELSGPAREELAGIAGSARSALVEMRRLLGVLRADTDEPPRAPQPGLSDLPALVAAAERAGMAVSFTLTGGAEVPEPAGLAAYRVVQEALANAARHAPGAPVEVAVLALPDRLELAVRNGPPGSPPAPAPGGGHGLIGMRERAALLGGAFSAGPDARGGFVVTARLPYGGPPR